MIELHKSMSLSSLPINLPKNHPGVKFIQFYKEISDFKFAHSWPSSRFWLYCFDQLVEREKNKSVSLHFQVDCQDYYYFH